MYNNDNIFITPNKKIDQLKYFDYNNISVDFNYESSEENSSKISFNTSLKSFCEHMEKYYAKYLSNENNSKNEKSFDSFKDNEAKKIYNRSSENYSVNYVKTIKNAKFTLFNSTSKVNENIKKFDSLNNHFKLFKKVKLCTYFKNKFNHHLCFYNDINDEKYFFPLYKDEEIGFNYFYKYLLKENWIDFEDFSKDENLNRADVKCIVDLNEAMNVVMKEKYYKNKKFFD